MPRVIVIGGHGKVALQLARILTERGDDVRLQQRRYSHRRGAGSLTSCERDATVTLARERDDSVTFEHYLVIERVAAAPEVQAGA
jgi:nucleoside-diphosphate-sugar epimerase